MIISLCHTIIWTFHSKRMIAVLLYLYKCVPREFICPSNSADPSQMSMCSSLHGFNLRYVKVWCWSTAHIKSYISPTRFSSKFKPPSHRPVGSHQHFPTTWAPYICSSVGVVYNNLHLQMFEYFIVTHHCNLTNQLHNGIYTCNMRERQI